MSRRSSSRMISGAAETTYEQTEYLKRKDFPVTAAPPSTCRFSTSTLRPARARYAALTVMATANDDDVVFVGHAFSVCSVLENR